jgi:hypothetical protein
MQKDLPSYLAGHVAKCLADGVAKLAVDAPTPGLADAAKRAAELKRDAGLLHDAWSPMAKRNLTADLLRLAKAMRAPLSAALLQARASRNAAVTKCAENCDRLCKSVIDRCEILLQQHSPSRARYDRVVCLGYKVKVTASVYQGKADDAEDMRRKCGHLVGAIQAAHRLAGQGVPDFNMDNRVLKVFVAPEFFFRGRNGAYSHDVVHGMQRQVTRGGDVRESQQGIIDILKAEIDKPAYKDWLFVLGTAIAATEEVATRCRQPGCAGPVKFVPVPGQKTTRGVCSVSEAHPVAEVVVGAMVENVAFVSKEGWRHTVSKELVSRVDFMERGGKHKHEVSVQVGDNPAPTKLDVVRVAQPSLYNAATALPPKFADERMGGCVFTVDGITFGLEVCLDHAATRGDDSAGRLDHAANIQVQLIPSAGMSVGSLRTVTGGIVFNVDGATPHVEVVAGAVPEARFSYDKDLRLDGATWAAMRDVGTDIDDLRAVDSSITLKLAVPPPTGPAGRGSVLMYGPYDIPAV